MKKLIKAPKLKKGDKVATISLSGGLAGDKEILWRYEQGKRQLQEELGLEVIEMPHTLAGSKFIYEHPELRAKDFMDAFKDDSIKGIITCIGGIESVRMLPYIDFDIIKNNPKVFLGYSDTTTSHLICYKAGLQSFYGPTLLVDFAENNGMDPYTVDYLKRVLFDESSIIEIKPAKKWTSEYLPWEIENKNISRKMKENTGHEWIQGENKSVTGHLIGGCIEVFDTHRGNILFPKLDDFEDAILFFETSEDMPEPWFIECGLRSYGIMGILERVNGILWGKPMHEKYYKEYNEKILQVLKEFGREDMPVVCNMNFGHTEPKITIPYGAKCIIENNKVMIHT